MAEPTQVVLAFWQDQRLQAQRTEDQRATMTNIVLTLSAATFVFLTQKGLTSTTFPITCGLVVLGLVGAVASAKLYERYRMHMTQSLAFASQLEGLHPGLELDSTRLAGRARHENEYRLLYRIPVHAVWIGIHLCIAATGLILAAVAANG